MIIYFYFFQELTEEERGLRFTNAALKAKSALFEDDRKAMVSTRKVRWFFSCFWSFEFFDENLMKKYFQFLFSRKNLFWNIIFKKIVSFFHLLNS